ncbi:hypothetical protein E5288_WYG022054 [Bos mutus]|uniref:Uncharacterized protein n=1 Tax=Bos mutus TaxID=72004 RepID=A0A6B0RYS6_9CETA|nr:hypothetical protein [Bos mutus]
MGTSLRVNEESGRRAAAQAALSRLERKAARLLAPVDEKEATSGQERDALSKREKTVYLSTGYSEQREPSSGARDAQKY